MGHCITSQTHRSHQPIRTTMGRRPRVTANRSNTTNRRTMLFPSGRRDDFQEKPGAAFFLGKLDKTQNRDEVYTGVRRLGKKYGFYVRKLDMPYGDSKNRQGNRGYCFVHCNSKEEADKIVELKEVHIGRQLCEVKAYGGRDIPSGAVSDATSGYNTPNMQRSMYNISRATTPSVFGDDASEQQISSQQYSELPQTSERINVIPEPAVQSSRGPTGHVDQPISSSERILSTGQSILLQNPSLPASVTTQQYIEPVAAIPPPLALSTSAIPGIMPQTINVASNTSVMDAYGQELNLGELYNPERVNRFVISQLLKASSSGDAMRFLSTYFNELDRFEKGLASMDSASVQLVAKMFAPLLVNV